MPSVLSQARQMCPELSDGVKALNSLASSRQYGEVFNDLIDWLVFQHLMPPSEESPIAKYTAEEQEQFLAIFKNIQEETKKRVNMWVSPDNPQQYQSGNWYDPLGKMYETITSRYKSSRMGQFFTPQPVVDMMVQITKNSETKEMQHVLDPACGSGRMGLAVSNHRLAHGAPTWVTMNDLDPICTSMTAVNMCLNGVVGEAVCMNGLDITGESFRFAYRVEPALADVPQEMWEYYRMLVLFKTGEDVKKQYVLKPIPYEKTYLKQVNDSVLHELKERQKIADELEREKAVEELKDTVRARMAGTLFENDDSFIEKIKPEFDMTKKSRKKNTPKGGENSNNGNQGTLF